MALIGNTMQTILSIIIPVYNVEKYIKMTLDSIFSQNYQREDIEVIVVNDGTPDHSMAIVDQFVSRYSNICVINQGNQGLSGARNTGLKEAHGKYVWFVDSDDMLGDDILRRVLPLLKEGDADAYMFRIKEIDEDGNILKERHFFDDKKVHYCSGIDVIKNMSRYNILYTPMQIYMIKTEFLRSNQLEFVCGIYHEDMEFAPRMLIKAERIAYVPWYSYYYVRRKAQSITSDLSKLNKRLYDLRIIADCHYKMMKMQQSKAVCKAMGYATYRSIAYFYSLCPQKEFRSFWKEMEKSHIPYKRIVWMCLYHNHSYKLFFRQLIFLLSPYLLKRFGKRIE